MAILNTIDIMGPNYIMRYTAYGLIALMIFFIVLACRETKSPAKTILFTFLTVASFVTSMFLFYIHDDPEFYIPSGDVQIEATFAKGKPSAYILEKYNVIEQRDNLYVLEEKK